MRILKTLAILTLLTIIATTFVMEDPTLMTKYLGLHVPPPKEWPFALYAIMFALLPISIAVLLIPKN